MGQKGVNRKRKCAPHTLTHKHTASPALTHTHTDTHTRAPARSQTHLPLRSRFLQIYAKKQHAIHFFPVSFFVLFPTAAWKYATPLFRRPLLTLLKAPAAGWRFLNTDYKSHEVVRVYAYVCVNCNTYLFNSDIYCFSSTCADRDLCLYGFLEHFENAT